MPNKPKRPPYELSIIIPDLHLPRESRKSVAAVEKYAADEYWHNWICLGDLLDNEAISSHNAGQPRKIANAPTVSYQFDYANRFLDRHLGAVRAKNPGCNLVYLEGNHEERTERYVDKMPELQGLVDVEGALRLKDRGVRYVRFWSKGDMYKLGKLHFAHGAYTVQGHASKHVNKYGANVMYGHVHDIQSFSIQRLTSRTSIMGQSCGCLCEYNQGYMKGQPSNWQHAFGVVWTFPDGHFQHMVVPIFNGRFVGPTNGVVYG